ncbi:MAG: histidine kinase [Bacteroidota bacterium]|nr:histidine kinase [Bacteroidota bacterium]
MQTGFLFLALVAFSPAHAQFYQLKNYNVKDGLPSSEVYAMMQDASGYLWFTTDMGVSRFNGYEFKNFSTEHGLAENTNFGLSQDHKGRIWFRSFSGRLSYFENEVMHSIPCNDTLETLLRGKMLTSLYVDKGDTIWAGTVQDYVLKISPGWKTKDVSLVALKSSGGYLILIDDEGFVFGGSSPAFLDIQMYDRSLRAKEIIPTHIDRLNNVAFRFTITRLRDKTFVATINNTITRFIPGKIYSRSLTSGVIICVQEQNDKSIFVGMYGGAEQYTDHTFTNKTLLSNFKQKIITAICCDHENSLWFCTEGNGVFSIPFYNFTYYTPADGLSESKISCVGKFGGKVICGYLDGTVSILDHQEVTSVRINEANDSASSMNRISSILCMNDQVIIGLIKNIYRLDLVTLKKKILTQEGTKKIIAAKGKGIWSLRFRRLVHYSLSDSLRSRKSFPLEVYTDNIYEDHNGLVWICTANGLYTYDSIAGVSPLKKDHPLLSLRIVETEESADGTMWMASRGNGVIVKRNDSYFSITQRDGLAGNMCRSIFIDTDSVIWIGTNNGLSKIKVIPGGEFKYTITNYTSKNGLLTNEVNDILRQENKLWLVHNNGISIFDPTHIGNNTNPPPVYITSLMVNDSVTKMASHSFPHNQNYFNISFIGLSYKDPGKLEYRYRMEGIDSNWIYTPYTAVKYQTLPPGDYRFVVYAKNNDGFWSKDPATLSFTVLPAWWQTWPFKISVSLILLTLIFLIFRTRISIIRKRDLKKSILQTRIAGIELNALRAQMNPHFVFNAINSVQYFITTNDPDSSQKYLSKFARLIRYVVDNSKLTSIPVKREIEALTLYLELEALRFGKHFEYVLKVHPNVDTEYTQIPSMLIQPYVENSIWHGIMHKEGRGKIEIVLEMKGNILYCVVQDNGIGRKRSMELKLEKDGLHKSVGMSNTRERLEIINQVNNSEMSVNVSDVLNENGEICGTKVEIHIPIS